MLNTTFSPWPSYTNAEAQLVQSILLSNRVNYWTGNEARNFETEYANHLGVKHAISLMNGTVALELALRALDIGVGDEVVVSPRSFIASVSCVINVGATPIFADVDCYSGNISAESISKVLSKKTRAIICVHLAGWPCDMDPIMYLADKHGLKVIEDCAQAHGAVYKGKMVGSIGHISCWSFCQDKIITTGGEGGLVATNNDILWSRMWAYKDHGKSYELVNAQEKSSGFRWLHTSFGTNFRMTEIQAAIGRLQLKNLGGWTKRRNENAKAIYEALKIFSEVDGIVNIPFVKCNDCERGCSFKSDQDKCTHAYYKYYCYLNLEKLAKDWDRARIIEEINKEGVPCYTGSCSEIYLERAFDSTPFRPSRSLPNAKKLGETSLMFLVHPTLTQEEIFKTTKVINKVFSMATGVDS